MGSKNKLKRFHENETFSNVIQPTREEILNGFSLQGKWHTFFKNSNPIVLELGCGKGEYTIALAEKNPTKNFIGIDIKGARIVETAKEGDHVLVMSNGGFGGLHAELLARLKKRV